MADQSNTNTNAPGNVKSTQAVGGVGSTSVKDDPKTGPDGPTTSQVNTNDTKQPTQTITNAELDAERAKQPSTVDVSTQKALDSALGDGPEANERQVADMKTAKQHHAQMNSNPGLIKRLESFVEGEGGPLKVITDLLSVIPGDTPDDYILGGHAGKKLKLGHLRALIANIL